MQVYSATVKAYHDPKCTPHYSVPLHSQAQLALRILAGQCRYYQRGRTHEPPLTAVPPYHVQQHS